MYKKPDPVWPRRGREARSADCAECRVRGEAEDVNRLDGDGQECEADEAEGETENGRKREKRALSLSLCLALPPPLLLHCFDGRTKGVRE